jgi:acyl carrier protein
MSQGEGGVVNGTGTAAGQRPGRDDVFAVVRDAVATVLERDPTSVTWDSDFADLHADSLALVEVAEIVEEQLAPYAPGEFRIADDELERLRTVGEAVTLALARL